MKTPRKTFSTLGLATFLAFWSSLAGCRPGADGGLSQGAPAPPFELRALSGETVSSASLSGDLVVLNFWATWCGPCRREIPTLKKLDLEGDVRVVGINLDFGAEAEVDRFVTKNHIEYTILMGNENVAEAYGVGAIPTTLVLDRSQNVVRRYRGLVSEQTLRSALEHARAAG